jgi:peptide chain release factor subunit 1
MLTDKITYGLVVVGRKRATIGYIRGTLIHIIKEFTSGVHGKHKQGGQSQARFERQTEEEEKKFYRRLIKHMNQEFLSIKNLRSIFVGGAGNSKKKFVKDKNIDYRLKPIIMDTIDLPYDGGYEGIRALVNKMSDQLIDLRYTREKQIVQKFLGELSIDSGLAIYGYEEIKKALLNNAVSILIISEGLKNLNDFMALAIKNRIQVEIISKETEEGEMVYKSFGGIVAIARYST